MEISAQRVRSKARSAVKRREDQIEQEETESGELNLIPYLDMVTNLMLFLLASVSAGIVFTQIDTTLPDKGTPPPNGAQQDPNEQPLGIYVSITRDRMIIWSISQLEGTLKEPHGAPFLRTGRDGDSCDGNYMCESNSCNSETNKCIAGKDPIAPVFDYRALSASLFEIANRRYGGKNRKADTYQIVLQADPGIPYSTVASTMAAMRCKMPDFGKEPTGCALPTEDPELKKAKDPISPDKRLFDTSRAAYDPKTMALFSDIQFSSGIQAQ